MVKGLKMMINKKPQPVRCIGESIHFLSFAILCLQFCQVVIVLSDAVKDQFSPCVAYRKLLDKTLVCQGLFGFTYCSLL